MISRKKLSLCVVVLALSLSGCATSGANYRPLIDAKSVDMNRFETDLGECRQYALQVAGAGEKAAGGAIAGALFGALLAAAAGGGYDRGASARVGLLTGAVSGGASGEQDQRTVIKNCLGGRGYRVLQ